jgi:hypothetical protein
VLIDDVADGQVQVEFGNSPEVVLGRGSLLGKFTAKSIEEGAVIGHWTIVPARSGFRA